MHHEHKLIKEASHWQTVLMGPLETLKGHTLVNVSVFLQFGHRLANGIHDTSSTPCRPLTLLHAGEDG